MANVDAFPCLDVKTKLVDALLQIHSMEYRVYELEGEINHMGGIMRQLKNLVTTQEEIGRGTIQDLDMVKGRLGMLSMSGTMRYSRSSLASASVSPLALASLQTSGSSLLVTLTEITLQGMEEAHCPIPAEESPQYLHDDANPGANVIEAEQANAVPISGGPSTPGVVLIPPTPQMLQEVAAYGAVPLVSIPHPQDTVDENANIQMTTDGTDATGENEGLSSDTAGKVHATTNISLALFCTHANATQTPYQLMLSQSSSSMNASPVTHSHSCSHLSPIPPEDFH